MSSTAQNIASITSFGLPFLIPSIIPDGTLDASDRAVIGWSYAGIEYSFVSDVTRSVRRSILDNYIIKKGVVATLITSPDLPNRDSGIYPNTIEKRVYVKRVNIKTNVIGKDKDFLTSFMAFGRTQPLRKMRFTLNGITNEIVDIGNEEENVYLLRCETRQ